MYDCMSSTNLYQYHSTKTNQIISNPSVTKGLYYLHNLIDIKCSSTCIYIYIYIYVCVCVCVCVQSML